MSKIALIMMATMMRMGMIMHQVVDAVRGPGGRIRAIMSTVKVALITAVIAF